MDKRVLAASQCRGNGARLDATATEATHEVAGRGSRAPTELGLAVPRTSTTTTLCSRNPIVELHRSSASRLTRRRFCDIESYCCAVNETENLSS